MPRGEWTVERQREVDVRADEREISPSERGGVVCCVMQSFLDGKWNQGERSGFSFFLQRSGVESWETRGGCFFTLSFVYCV